MKCLVTGGAGFIGSHLTDALLARGDEVTVIDDLSTGTRENLASALAGGAELIEGDVLDREFIEDAVAGAEPGVIFHLAAQGEVRRSIEQPAFDASVNVVGTINLLEAARVTGVGRFMLASSGGAIYGEGSRLDLPAVESSSLEPLCPYGLSKLAGEQYLLLYRRMYGLSSVALRFANVYGPRQRPKGEAGAVAIFGELLLEGRQPTVFGDGTQTRDFVYIYDVITAVLAATDSGMEGPVNIGSGVETSLLELLEGLSAAGPGDNSFDPVYDPPVEGEVKRISIDPARAESELGWQVTVGLEDGLRRTLAAL